MQEIHNQIKVTTKHCTLYKTCYHYIATRSDNSTKQQEGQHPLTGQRAANFRLLSNQ